MFKAVLALVVLAFLLRIIFIFSGGVSFHYDMARDAYEARQIWQYHHLKILGPPTSTPGLYHGVLYYYLIAPFYQLGNGDPRVVAVFLSLINALAIVPVILLAKDFFKSMKWAILAGLLFAVSFEATQYASWISNPAPAVLTMAWFFLSLRWWQEGKKYGLYLAVLFAVLSTQFQFFLVYLFILMPIFGIIFKIKTDAKTIGLSFVVAGLGLFNFFIAAIKFKTWIGYLLGFINIGSSQIDFRPQFSESLLNYIDKFTGTFTLNFSPTSIVLGGISAMIVLYVVRRERLLLFYLFSNIPIFLFGGHTNTYATIGLAVPAILSIIYLLQKGWKVNKLLVIMLVFLSFISNIYTIFKYNPDGQLILVIPNDMNLKNELKLIDKTYELAHYNPFSINTITLPLWTNTTWSYLYSWYGKKKYGYAPAFYGHDQVGLLGAGDLQKIDKPLKYSFLIAEPMDGIPPRFYNEDLDTENSKTQLISETTYSSLKLQFRTPKANE